MKNGFRKLLPILLTVMTLTVVLLTPTTALSVQNKAEHYFITSPYGVNRSDYNAYVRSTLLPRMFSTVYGNAGGTSAYYLRRTMNDIEYFSVLTHGWPGRVQCYPYGGAGSMTTMSTKIVYTDDANYSLGALFSSGNKLRYLKFAVYLCCYSANSDSTYGNMAYDTRYTFLAGCALGFDGTPVNGSVQYFEKIMLEYLADGYTIASAVSNAKAQAKNGPYGEGNVKLAKLYGIDSQTFS